MKYRKIVKIKTESEDDDQEVSLIDSDNLSMKSAEKMTKVELDLFIFCQCYGEDCQLRMRKSHPQFDSLALKDCENIISTKKSCRCTSGFQLFSKCKYDRCRQCKKNTSTYLMRLLYIYFCTHYK